MGLADFLAEAGRGRPIGNIASALGGKTSGQRDLEDFINNQLPALADQIHKATTRDDITRSGQALIGAGLKAGINEQGVSKLMDMVIHPALQNVQGGELDALRNELQGQPGSPRPQGGDALVKGPDIAPVPAEPFDIPRAIRFGQATGANAEQMRHLLSTPAEIANKEASTKKTVGEVTAQEARQTRLNALSTAPLDTAPGYGFSMRDLAEFPSLAQTLPNRAPSDAAQDIANQKTQIQADAAAGRATTAAGHLANEAERLRIERDRLNQQQTGEKPMTDAQLRTAYQRALIDREKLRRGPITEMLSGGQTEGYDAANAQAKALEDEMKSRGLLPGSPSTEFTPRQPATPRAPQPAGQGRYSQGVPTGSAPAPAQAGRGSAPAKPKRIKFDVNGNQIP